MLTKCRHPSPVAALHLLGHLLLDVRLYLLALDVEAEAVVEAHVLVCDPDEREAADEIAAPVFVEQLVARNEEEEDCDVVAEAVFAGKEIEELPLVPAATILALAHAELTRLAEDLLVCHRPGNARDGNCEQEEHCDL